MARINLLPWREELRKQQKKNFLAALGLAVGFTVVILFLVRSHLNGKIEYQNQRNQYLNEQIAIVDKKIKEIKDLEAQKNKLIAKMEVIQQLQVSRPEIVHLFDQIAKTLPEGIYITQFVQSGTHLTLDGIAQSNARVSAYMRNLEASPWMKAPRLNIIESKNATKERRSYFTLQAQQASPKSNDQEADK